MPVVSLDLAVRRYADNGLAILRTEGDAVACQLVEIPAGLGREPEPERFASFLAETASEAGARLLFIDGPQAWKSPDSALEHQRRCEQAFHTPGKTGLPGVVKPRTWTRFAEFSVALFDALASLGWPRLPTPGAIRGGSPHALESFPTAAWRSLGLPPLPGKAKAPPARVAEQLRRLQDVCPLSVSAPPSHDELQAIVAGLAGIAVELEQDACWRLEGCEPFEREGVWREGFIAVPALPDGVHAVRCLARRCG